ncbi:hypothetical protein D3C76_934770 [compost metagenome]
MALEITGDAADGIVRVVPDIDVAVSVEVHRIGAKAARHELRQAHGAGVGALEGQWVDLLFPGQQQELTQFLAEKFGTGRIVETEGRQGVNYPEITGIAAKKGLNADNRDNYLRRHAVFLLGTGQYGLMLAPEVDATGNTRIGDEHRPVFVPLLDPFGGFRNGVQDRLFTLRLAEHAHQLLTGEAIVAGHLADELGHLGRAFVIAGRRLRRSAKDAYQADPWRVSSRPATHYLH